MKILLTGASGLVGSEFAAIFQGSPASEECMRIPKPLRNSQILKTCLQNRDGFISADISSDEGIARLGKLDFDAVIHSAAWRDPDRCLKNKEKAEQINSVATRRLAELARSKGAFMLYVSTDYVFDGGNPPYAEDSITNPVNHYGQTKLMGENSVRESGAKFAILRIPLQYGMASGLPACPMLATSLNALRSPRPWPMEDSIVRYPTYSGDVADALIFILSRSLEGVFHFSGQDKTTRYKMTIEIGKILGLDPSNVLRLENPPQGEEARPKDSHLSADKLFRLGFPKPLSFSERIKSLKKVLLETIHYT